LHEEPPTSPPLGRAPLCFFLRLTDSIRARTPKSFSTIFYAYPSSFEHEFRPGSPPPLPDATRRGRTRHFPRAFPSPLACEVLLREGCSSARPPKEDPDSPIMGSRPAYRHGGFLSFILPATCARKAVPVSSYPSRYHRHQSGFSGPKGHRSRRSSMRFFPLFSPPSTPVKAFPQFQGLRTRPNFPPVPVGRGREWLDRGAP